MRDIHAQLTSCQSMLSNLSAKVSVAVWGVDIAFENDWP